MDELVDTDRGEGALDGRPGPQPCMVPALATIAGENRAVTRSFQGRENPPVIGAEWTGSQVHRSAADVLKRLATDRQLLLQLSMPEIPPWLVVHSMTPDRHAAGLQCAQLVEGQETGLADAARTNKKDRSHSALQQRGKRYLVVGGIPVIKGDQDPVVSHHAVQDGLEMRSVQPAGILPGVYLPAQGAQAVEVENDYGRLLHRNLHHPILSS